MKRYIRKSVYVWSYVLASKLKQVLVVSFCCSNLTISLFAFRMLMTVNTNMIKLNIRRIWNPKLMRSDTEFFF